MAAARQLSVTDENTDHDVVLDLHTVPLWCEVFFLHAGSLQSVVCVCARSVPVSASAIILRDGDEDRNRSLAL